MDGSGAVGMDIHWLEASEVHFRDTLVGGAGLNDPRLVRLMCEEGPARLADLVALGARFQARNGDLIRTKSGDHSFARSVAAEGYRGLDMEFFQFLPWRVIAPIGHGAGGIHATQPGPCRPAGAPGRGSGGRPADRGAVFRRRLRQAMWTGAGIVRSGPQLTQTLRCLDELEGVAAEVGASAPAEFADRVETENLILVGRALCLAALTREETRGAHTRLDFPERDDATWLRGIVVSSTPDRRLRANVVPVPGTEEKSVSPACRRATERSRQ